MPSLSKAAEAPVVILGAGATKACGGALTDEILPAAFKTLGAETDSLSVLDEFLTEKFYLPPVSNRRDQDYPSLPVLLSLVDTAIDRKHAFGRRWPPDRVRQVRASTEYAIFTVLKNTLKALPSGSNHHERLLRFLPKSQKPTVISLNYDIIIDNTYARLGTERNRTSGVLHMPDYGTEVAPSRGRQSRSYGNLLKIHGSLHWLYCPSCSRLRVNIARTRAYFIKGIWNREQPCESCGSFLQPVMITPTHLKDYRNPHIARVWYEAERALRSADRVIIIGYSLPHDDIEVAYLLKRSLDRLPKKRLTVVEYDEKQSARTENDTWRRYRILFGKDFEWRTEGFKGWIDMCESKRRNPFRSRLDRVGF